MAGIRAARPRPPLTALPPTPTHRQPAQLASGEPPRVNVASFRLLFMIVRDDPPQLEGPGFSTDFKDFVWQCLRKVRAGREGSATRRACGRRAALPPRRPRPPSTHCPVTLATPPPLRHAGPRGAPQRSRPPRAPICGGGRGGTARAGAARRRLPAAPARACLRRSRRGG